MAKQKIKHPTFGDVSEVDEEDAAAWEKQGWILVGRRPAEPKKAAEVASRATRNPHSLSPPAGGRRTTPSGPRTT